jgi:hypothetical protein
MTDVTLEGWMPEIGPGLSLQDVVDKAFDYRGNVTVVRTDGSETEGYLFNRNAAAPVPFVQMVELSGEGPRTIAYRRHSHDPVQRPGHGGGQLLRGVAARRSRQTGNVPRRAPAQRPQGACDHVLVVTAVDLEARGLARHLGLARVTGCDWPHYRGGRSIWSAPVPALRISRRAAPKSSRLHS